MSILKEEYSVIAPRLEYLSNEVILAQAWKKTHKYIRRHNWYADVLELDNSTINLEVTLTKWVELLKSGEYMPDKMLLVPAPKNKTWHFSNDSVSEFKMWAPARETKDGVVNDEQKLRPLAHLSIRDQTLATAVMLCLANAVETAQGPSEEEDVLKAQRQRIYSYGNRLHCDWVDISGKNKRAQFGWGNSHSYRKFYEDYQKFLSRPKHICHHFAAKLAPINNLFVISLDLKGYFDNIDLDALQLQLRKIYEEYLNDYGLGSAYKSEESFWNAMKQIFNWGWESHLESNLFDRNELPPGLPQGLMASGFFSNAYLLDFDKKIGDQINRTIKRGIQYIVRDYCRYVDDIRLVVEVVDSRDSELIKREITDFVQGFLDEHTNNINAKIGLNLNREKTTVVPFRQLSTQSNVSSLMNLFQGLLSGTPDVESLREAAGGLDGLLQLSIQLEKDRNDQTNKLELSRFATPNFDVRDDTLKRFVASRITNSLRLRRGMMDLEETLGNQEKVLENVTTGQIMDHEFEATARKLIACWANNPSLTLLLRCGLDLYPDPVLLGPVIEALEVKLFQIDESNIKEIKAIEYVVSDLFRAGAVELGYRPEIEYPESADREAFRQELASFAKRIFNERPKSPWYVKQQAALYLASLGDTVEMSREKQDRLHQYFLLHEILLYRAVDERNHLEWCSISLVAQQLHANPKKFAHWFVQQLRKVDDLNLQIKIVLLVATNRPDLFVEIQKIRKARNAPWAQYIPHGIKELLSPPKTNLFSSKELPLLRIIQSCENPFVQENAILLLVYKILINEQAEDILNSGLSVEGITVKCNDWDSIQRLEHIGPFMEVCLENSTDQDERNKQPSWVKKESLWLYSLGRIIRSCITGEYDFTTQTYLMREDIGRYIGLRSTWFSRRFGLLNSSSGLSKEQSPISPWLSELLIRLLQWPGIEIHGEQIKEFDLIRTVADLRRIIEKRIKYQQKLYGRLSDTPVYELPTISIDESTNTTFRVVIVQTMLPKVKDFNSKDPTSWSASYRARHRAHIASVCNLVRKKLETWCDAQQFSDTQTVDLIVFPELAIHPDDIWLLRRLSDATKASIFAGMTFLRRKPKAKPINQAIWILRSMRRSGREFIEVRQGKYHMTKEEKKIGINSHRPYQVLVEFNKNRDHTIRVAGAICYDATDLALAADLRGVSDIFIVTALNKDVHTFDNMVGALHYHMYQPVILANSGEFGGSTAQAPYKKHDRLIAHVHGSNQVAISVFEFDPTVFKTINSVKKSIEVKTSPAGYHGR